MRKTIISSVSNFVNILTQNQALLQIPAFQHLRPILQQASQQKGCNCNKGNYINQKRKTFQAAMTSLQENEKTRMKEILKTDQICYHILRPDGKLDLACF